eukprot:TRINITY_DN8373_c0_g1_i8.p1 TRINITY_DN8373_c0_g1~~TRINITY_DN8373_c0_g1_i8.p1  ORF type:complete len:202 (+),score=59.77 TRINITY_DN8373_c0_g1_i8:76-681(+)
MCIRDSNNLSLATMTEGKLETFSCGSPGFVAPEVLQKMGYGLKADIFSCGVVLYMLLTGISPFTAPQVEQIIEKNRVGEVEYLDDIWKNISSEALDLVENMLKLDQYTRPTATQCLKHPWFRKESRNVLGFALRNIQSYVKEETSMPNDQPKSSSNLLTIGSFVASGSFIINEEVPKPKGLNNVFAKIIHRSYRKCCKKLS